MNKKGQEEMIVDEPPKSFNLIFIVSIIAILIIAGILAYVYLIKPNINPAGDKCDINKDGTVDSKEQAQCGGTVIKDNQTKPLVDNQTKPPITDKPNQTAPTPTPNPAPSGNLSAYEDSPFGITWVLEEPYESDLGIVWIRPGLEWWQVELTKGNFDFSYWDDYVRDMYSSNKKPIMNLAPSNPWDQHICHPECASTMPVGSKYNCFYIYCNELDYKNYVKKTVERYDGDSDYGCSTSVHAANAADCYIFGDNQYPYSETRQAIENNPIKYWEILNEPFSGLWWRAYNPQNITGEYIQILTTSNTAIHQVCPDCKVVLGGLYDYTSGYIPPSGMTLSVIKRALDSADNPFDVMNFHPYGNRNGINSALNYYTQNYPNKELIITETAMSQFGAGKTDSISDERAEVIESQEILRRYALSLNARVKIIMWFTLKASSEAEFSGLLNSPDNTKRLIYYTYKLMTEKLEGLDWNNIETISGLPSNVYAYKFMKNGEPIYVVWWEYWNEPSLSIKNVNLVVSGITGDAKITQSVPHFNSGLLMRNSGQIYPNFFDVENKQVSGGQVSLTLGENPVYIESA